MDQELKNQHPSSLNVEYIHWSKLVVWFVQKLVTFLESTSFSKVAMSDFTTKIPTSKTSIRPYWKYNIFASSQKVHALKQRQLADSNTG